MKNSTDIIKQQIKEKINNIAKFNILIDWDSTIIATPKILINLWNNLYPDKPINWTNRFDWKFRPMINSEEELKQLFQLFDNEHFYDNPIYTDNNVVDIVNRLAETNNVTIVSKHMKSRQKLTTEFIHKIFKNVDVKFVDNFEDKGKIPCDIIIDDKIETLKSFDSSVIKICFGNYHWNREWNFIRFSNWNAIDNYIYSLKKVKERYITDSGHMYDTNYLSMLNKINIMRDYNKEENINGK